MLLRAKKDGLEEVWKSDKVLSCHYGTPIYLDGYLYGFDGRQEEGARLRCVEMKSGDVKWTQEGFGCGSMILADGKLVILTEDGDLVLAKATPDKYEELARATVLDEPAGAGAAGAGRRQAVRPRRAEAGVLEFEMKETDQRGASAP